MNRQKLATYNLLSALLLNILTILLGFITQRLFIFELGASAAGLHNLFSTITNIFVMADVGIGAAVIFHMYKPFARKQYSKIVILTNFYRKVCFGVSGIIVVGGLAVLPFLPLFVDSQQITVNMYVIFGMYIVSSVFSYLLTYKRAVLQADQRNYIISVIHIAYVLLLNGMQIAILVTTRSYYLFLLTLIVMKLLENIAINAYINKSYTFLRKSGKTGLDNKTKKNIIKMVKGSFFHNSAGHLVSSVDSIVVSSFFGLAVLGLYANYQMIFMAASILISQMFYAITANVGNLLVEGNNENTFRVVKRIRFLNLVLGLVSTSMLIVLLGPFIAIWLGNGFQLDGIVVAILIANFFLQVMRSSMLMLQNAAGMLYENRFVPIYETIINLVLSVTLAWLFGLVGVFIATVISVLFLHYVAYPKYAYQIILGRKKKEYVIAISWDIALMMVVAVVDYIALGLLSTYNVVAHIVIGTMFSVVMPLLLVSLAYWQSEEFSYFYKFFVDHFLHTKRRLQK